MSFDTGKENVSLVDSSATEWKYGNGNFDDSESPRYKVNVDAYCFNAEEQGYSYEHVGTSSFKKHRSNGTRYFIIKSLNHENIRLSVEKGIWATQVMNEPILEEAFHVRCFSFWYRCIHNLFMVHREHILVLQNSAKVILIFSVNMSGFFQGYAQMVSSVGWRRDNVWSQGSGGSKPWGRSFKVKWLQLHDLPFQNTLHLKNPLNHYKPVKISRDCQELPQDIGEALCELLDGNIDIDDNGTRNKFDRDKLQLEKPCIDPSGSVHDEVYNLPPMPRTLRGTSMLYPSLFYQHPVESCGNNVAHQRSAQIYLHDNSPVTSGSPRERYHSRGDRSPASSALTDDDILEMTYEEYLEAHCRYNIRSQRTASGPSRKSQDSSSTKENSDDSYTADRRMKKRSHQESLE